MQVSIPNPTSGQFAFDDPDAAGHKRRLEFIDEIRRSVFQGVILVVLALVVVGCLWVVVRPGYPATTTDKALGILIAIVGGFVGYITGQATKK